MKNRGVKTRVSQTYPPQKNLVLEISGLTSRLRVHTYVKFLGSIHHLVSIGSLDFLTDSSDDLVLSFQMVALNPYLSLEVQLLSWWVVLLSGRTLSQTVSSVWCIYPSFSMFCSSFSWVTTVTDYHLIMCILFSCAILCSYFHLIMKQSGNF